MNRTEELILGREIKGIRFLLIAKMIIVVIMMASLSGTTQNLRELLSTLTILITGLILMFILLYLLRRQRNVRMVGMLSVILDLMILLPLNFIWYNAVGGDAVPRTYLLKTYLPELIYMMMILEALALQPLYPLVFAAGSSIALGIYYLYASADPRFSGTSDFFRALLGPSVHTNMYLINILMTAGAGLALFFITSIARRTIFQATKYEVAAHQLSRYFSPSIADAIAEAGTEFMKPHGRLQNAAVLFCDIRDFTSLSESQPAGEIMDLLSAYHRRVVDVIFTHSGTLDKFIGDGILATFGTPEPGSDDAIRAVRAGVGIRKAVEDMNAERRAGGLFEIRIGVGIHYGQLIAGNIGVENRLEYTVIGDTVNLASRIEGLCKTTGKDLLVSRAVADSLHGEFEIVSQGIFTVKGKSGSVEVFTVR